MKLIEHGWYIHKRYKKHKYLIYISKIENTTMNISVYFRGNIFRQHNSIRTDLWDSYSENEFEYLTNNYDLVKCLYLN